MRKSILVILICLFSIPLMAAGSDSSVVFKVSFLKHELQTYEISRALYTIQKGDTTSLELLRLKADVYVLDSTENYYVLSWKFSEFTINSDSPQLMKLIALAKPVEIRCRITKPGTLIEFLNGENVTTSLEEALPKVLEQFAGKKGPEAQAEVARIYDMRETLETLMLRSVNQFLQVYGLGYTLGEVVNVPTEVNSRFSSTPIKGVVCKKLTKIDSANHLAVLSTATFLDKNEFQKALKNYLHLDSIPESSMSQENMGSIVVDLNTGWVLWSFDQHQTRAGSSIYGEMVEIQCLP